MQVISEACVQSYGLVYCQQKVVNNMTKLQLPPVSPMALNNSLAAPSSTMSMGAIIGAVVGSLIGGLLLAAFVARVAYMTR